MQDRYAVTVDLGTSVTSLCVARLSLGTAEVLFYKEAKSEGIRRGQVYNPLRCADVLRKLIHEAEDTLEISINQVAVALPRYPLKQVYHTVNTTRGNADASIEDSDIDGLQAVACDEFGRECAENELIYGCVAQSYSIGDSFQVCREEVVGASSDTLEGNFNIFYGPISPITSLRKVFSHIGIAAVEFFIPEQQGMSVLTDEERENGVALVEIGGGLTSVAIWKQGVLRSFTSFPFAGKSITSDIKGVCGFKEELAENIKLAFGACKVNMLQTMSDKLLDILDENTGEREVLPITTLTDIIGCRMNEIAQTAMFLICKSNYEDRLRSGIVLCGGTVETVGCTAMFKDLSGMPVRQGIARAENVISDEPALESLHGSTQAALLSLCAQQERFNCAGSKRDGLFANDAVAPAQETPASSEETTIENLDWEEVPAEGKKKKKEKKEKERKPRKPIFGNIRGIFEDYYDGIGEEAEETDQTE